MNNEIEAKKRILAQADGLTEEQLLSHLENISNWMDLKNKAVSRLEVLKAQRINHRKTLEEAQESLGKLAEGTSAALYAKIAALIRHISAVLSEVKNYY